MFKTKMMSPHWYVISSNRILLCLPSLCQVPINAFCLHSRVDDFHGSRSLDISTILASRNIHHYRIGDQVIIEAGPYKDWKGTVVWIDWNRTCWVWNSIDSSYSEEDWEKWRCKNGYTAFDIDNESHANSWRPDDKTRTLPATPEQLQLLDQANTLRSWTKRDFLINKRIVVIGAHEHKGMKGQVVDVNLSHRTAQVSLDAHSLVSKRILSIGLDNLMLDASKDR